MVLLAHSQQVREQVIDPGPTGCFHWTLTGTFHLELASKQVKKIKCTVGSFPMLNSILIKSKVIIQGIPVNIRMEVFNLVRQATINWTSLAKERQLVQMQVSWLMTISHWWGRHLKIRKETRRSQLIMIAVTIVNSAVVSSSDGLKLVPRAAAKTPSIGTQLPSSHDSVQVRIAPVEILASRATELTIQAKINMIKSKILKGVEKFLLV